MNNMVKVLLKKGLVTDLARVTHSLDLSSPSMANTVNSALKPLETLSRIVNQPQAAPRPTKSIPKTLQQVQEGLASSSTATENNSGMLHFIFS